MLFDFLMIGCYGNNALSHLAAVVWSGTLQIVEMSTCLEVNSFTVTQIQPDFRLHVCPVHCTNVDVSMLALKYTTYGKLSSSHCVKRTSASCYVNHLSDISKASLWLHRPQYVSVGFWRFYVELIGNVSGLSPSPIPSPVALSRPLFLWPR